MRLILRRHKDAPLHDLRDTVQDTPTLVNVSLDCAKDQGGPLVNLFIDTMFKINKVSKRADNFGTDEIVINVYHEKLNEGDIPKYPGELWTCPQPHKTKEAVFWMTASSEVSGVSHLQFIEPGQLIVDKKACTWEPEYLTEYLKHLHFDSLFLQDGLIIETLNQSPVRSRMAFKPGHWAVFNWSYIQTPHSNDEPRT